MFLPKHPAIAALCAFTLLAATSIASAEVYPRESMIKATPLHSLGEPDDIAAAALYLASPASRWVTGKILEVDGGAESSVWPG